MMRDKTHAEQPWDRGTPLEQVLRDIEQIAVSRGAVRGKQRINTNVDGLPLELQAFLSWFDPDIWSGFVNPAQERTSDRVVFSVDGEQITEDHLDDRVSDPIYILRPDEICSLNVRDESTSAFATVTDCYEDLGWDS
ncbi:MAG: hypothetical protein KDA31_07750 [Phycisphaerales bacterium]|nr:hypothetical protein [Phycisphaerales bacterium]MCB9836608.1 hypothetical protein [Phycisphaera sp.]